MERNRKEFRDLTLQTFKHSYGSEVILRETS